MKKYLILAAFAAVALGACTKVETTKTVVDEPIGFGAYTSRSLTKAGTPGEITSTTLQTPGFGVFAYQTTDAGYSSDAKPNFMYNQHVTYSSGWTYTPVKYWPNQIAGTASTGAGTDAQNPKANAYGVDKVSFFAYGPWVDHKATLGDSGITAFSANSVAGDPKVTYTVTNDLAKQVDLVWGVSHGETWTNVAGGANTPTKFLPYLNLQKPQVGTAIKFYFYHALSQLKLQALASYNQEAAGVADGGKDGVKITIEEVVITVPGMYQTAVLNLNNDQVDNNGTPDDASDDKAMPKWDTTSSSSSDLTLTINGDNLNTNLKDKGPNKASVQPAGVIYKDLSNTAYDADVDVIKAGQYYTLIPKTGSTTVNVKVTYYVTTDDANLEDEYSRVKNVISHDVTFANGFKAGTRNVIRMVLGISEVKFDAVVADWEEGDSQIVYLPQNDEA